MSAKKPVKMVSPMPQEVTTILAIDDDDNNLDIMSTCLTEQNYRVLTAKNGEEGMAVLRANASEIGVILLDRMMPKMDGMKFMQLTQQDASLPYIPIIMQTAAAESQQVIEGVNAGVYYYLTKPYDADVLLSIVRAAEMDYLLHAGQKHQLNTAQTVTDLITECHFEFRTLEEAKEVAVYMARLYPQPDKVLIGLPNC